MLSLQGPDHISRVKGRLLYSNPISSERRLHEVLINCLLPHQRVVALSGPEVEPIDHYVVSRLWAPPAVTRPDSPNNPVRPPLLLSSTSKFSSWCGARNRNVLPSLRKWSCGDAFVAGWLNQFPGGAAAFFFLSLLQVPKQTGSSKNRLYDVTSGLPLPHTATTTTTKRRDKKGYTPLSFLFLSSEPDEEEQRIDLWRGHVSLINEYLYRCLLTPVTMYKTLLGKVT